MAEYIERAKLMKFPIRIDHYDKEHGNVNFVYGVETVLEYAKNIPAADVVPVVHGRWMDGECGTFCTNCNRVFDEDFEIRREVCKKLIRCPNCGARMDGE